ncbi:unnamed protein product [Arabidopsis halleri]
MTLCLAVRILILVLKATMLCTCLQDEMVCPLLV